ncbi:MAG: alanyl-tRNA editing protein [Acidobacteriota bacterium]
MTTERLYYSDCYLREFQANVIDTSADGHLVYLDRSAFYPTSGGQLFDLGTMNGIAVTEVVDEEERVAHRLAEPLTSNVVTAVIDWQRRYDLMQQHTGQHLLSAVLEELFQCATVSVHMGAEQSTIDVAATSVSAEQLEQAELRCAELVGEARPVHIRFEDAAEVEGLRKASARTGTLRIAEIEGTDRSACGGTHVRNTAEIGPVLTGKLDKMRGNTRIEFVCGERALRRSRTDHLLLAAIGRSLSAAPEQFLSMIDGMTEKNRTLEKERLRLATELARREGQELYQATEPGGSGIRKHTARGPIDDAVRTRAQAFVASPRAVYLAICDQPPSILLAASADSGVHAGNQLKAALSTVGGRGGGNQGLAQGSLPDMSTLETVIKTLQGDN